MDNMDGLDIPDFLRATPENTAASRAAWKKPPKQRRPAKVKTKAFHLPKTMEPEAWALLRRIEKEKAEKQKARLAALKEWKARKR